ncbi:MAG: ATP-binding protein [Saprospiraceae bacterium]
MNQSDVLYPSAGAYSSDDLANLEVMGMRRNGYVVAICSLISLVSIFIYGFQMNLILSVVGLGVSSFLVGVYLNEKYLALSQRVLVAFVFIIIASWAELSQSISTTLYFVPLFAFIFTTEGNRSFRVFYVFASLLVVYSMCLRFFPAVGLDGISSSLLQLETLMDCIMATVFSGLFIRNYTVFSRITIEVAKAHGARLKTSMEQTKITISELEHRRTHLSAIQEKTSLALENERVAAREIRASQEQLEQFAYAASHDLKEPVRTVRSFYQVIRRRIDPEVLAKAEISTLFELVEGRSSSMHNMLERLLLFSRLSSNQGKSQGLPLKSLLEETLLVQGGNSNLEVDINASCEEVRLDQSRAKRLFQEIMSNAIAFASPERPLELVFTAERVREGFVSCTLSDNGIGISQQDLPRVIGLFQRLQKDDKTSTSGLGLSIAKAIVTMKGGDFFLTSDGECGTTVHFELPVG